MLCLAFFAGIALAAWRARREKLDENVVYDLAFWLLVGGLVGARAFYVWEYWGIRITSLAEIVKIWEGGIVFYGGAFGAALASFLYWLKVRFPLRRMLDVIAPSIALGLALGRVGCFLNGCCYGDECELPWAVSFPAESPPWYEQFRKGEIVFPAPTAPAPHLHYVEVVGNGPEAGRILRDPDAKPGDPPAPPEVGPRTFTGPDGKPFQETVRAVSVSARSRPVHPTQLYSVVDGLLLLALLSAYFPLRRRDGEVFALLMVAYAITRFLIEALRGDEPAFFAGMTISQNVSVLTFLMGLGLLAYLRRFSPRRPADEPAPAELASV
jgi:phosphatidylglycerol:prolipoprotein diacylglycerol transferase